MNVFRWEYRKSYYLTHPWRFFRDLGYNLKHAWQRATKGYCDTDTYNVDYWLLHTLPNMLREVAFEPYGSYPGKAPFDTEKKWQDWLCDMADRLEDLQEDWAESRNEYENKLNELMNKCMTTENGMTVVKYNFNSESNPEIEELRQKWVSRIDELRRLQEEETINVFSELAKYLYWIWS